MQPVGFVHREGVLGCGQVREIERFALQQVEQECRRAGFEPVVLELAGVEALHHRDRVVDGLCFLVEPIPIVPRPQLVERLLAGSADRAGQRFDIVREVRLQFLLRIAQQRGRVAAHGQVGEVVEVGEDRDLGELADAGEQDEALVGFGSFDDRVELLEHGLHVARRLPAQVPQQRLVVFVHQDHNFAVAVGEVGDKVFKCLIARLRCYLAAVLNSSAFHEAEQILFELVGVC